RELPPALRRRLISEAAGNPLALIELPRALADPELHLAGASSAALPLTEELQRAFLARVSTLPPEAQTLLLVAACDEGRELASIQRAARAVGVDDHAIAIAERAALLSVSEGEIRFRHPLVRSAGYQHATETERHRAHRALADALDAPDQADRRAWHRTLASLEIVVARSVITRHSRPRSR
ncbi:MAG TPA: hypothetical protein VMU39_31235, partial [Solirubrobacteraceae bacterium]|nr:hypothetical protein [Solirubrobacteraceae bacterium]